MKNVYLMCINDEEHATQPGHKLEKYKIYTGNFDSVDVRLKEQAYGFGWFKSRFIEVPRKDFPTELFRLCF